VSIIIIIMSQKLFYVLTVTSSSVVFQAITIAKKTVVATRKVRALVSTVAVGSVAHIDECYADIK
jgi:hypothetical protein